MLFSVEHFFLHISLIIDQIRHDGTLQVIATIDCILMELSCLSTELSTVFVGKWRNDLIEIRSFWCYFDSTGSVETREAHCLRCYPCFMVTSLTIWQSFAATLVTLSIF